MNLSDITQRLESFGGTIFEGHSGTNIGEADVVVSTAKHEFFGITVMEAADAGAFPVVPNSLAYPELLDPTANPDFFFDGTAEDLTNRIAELAERKQAGKLWESDDKRARRIASRFHWSILAEKFDEALQEMTDGI